MTQQSTPPFLLENVRGVSIVSLSGPKLGLEARESLYGLIERQGDRKLVLNFKNVRVLSSAPIGVLVNLVNKAKAAGGSVALCELDPDVREIMRLTAVEGLFVIFDTEQDAIDSFANA